MGLTHEDFVAALRSALHYLYDPVHLRRSPLVELFGLEKQFDAAGALQRLLTEAIQTFKPEEDEAALSPAWRTYDLLNLQYLRLASREDVAAQLGISERQLRREQRTVLEALAQSLWARAGAALPLADPQPRNPPIPPDSPALETDLDWLKENSLDQAVPLEEAIGAAIHLTQPLAADWNASVTCKIEAEMGGLPVPQQVLRSVLLTVLSIVIPRSAAKVIAIQAARESTNLVLRVEAGKSSRLDEKDRAALETARQLAGYMNAVFEVFEGGSNLAVVLSAAMPEQIPILVIDDNNDWLEMLKRYASGSRYRVIGLRDGQAARAAVEKLQPALVFLDVMMPNLDGWAILNELRQDPAVAQIPVVISTVLPLEGLALSLGANGFLQKPITQDRFLNELDRFSRQA